MEQMDAYGGSSGSKSQGRVLGTGKREREIEEEEDHKSVVKQEEAIGSTQGTQGDREGSPPPEEDEVSSMFTTTSEF